jgi:hypothetical protein
MRLGAIAFAVSLTLTATITAQDYSANTRRSSTTVIRPAETVAWRNYVAVPDGPCGCPMSVEADCYDQGCPHCNPLRFLRRVGRMLDCFKPCNLCCGTGGCGLLHGCRSGQCSICCGVACGGYGNCGSCGGVPSGCCPNPCGSAFSAIAPSSTCGGHCTGCSSALPTLSDPFIDDPPLPKPTSEPASEVRRSPAPRVRSSASHAAAATPASAPRPSPYKVVNAQRPQPSQRSATSLPGRQSAPGSSQSVLRRASVEQESREPAPLFIDHSSATPISRSAKPVKNYSYEVPSNPLR